MTAHNATEWSDLLVASAGAAWLTVRSLADSGGGQPLGRAWVLLVEILR